MLIGTATNKINLCTNSLSTVKDANAEERIIKEGAKTMSNTQKR